MILGFSTQIKGKPTCFVEKIWDGLIIKSISDSEEMWEYENRYKNEFSEWIDFNDANISKLHTIREDPKDRWKVGNKIDFFINVRTKKMFRFAPVLPVVSTQKVEITWIGFSNLKSNGDSIYNIYRPLVRVDGKNICTVDYIHNERMLQLAQNDGFDTIDDFFAYFNEDFTGKIIHWTDLKY